jgi:hypothetical protein
LASFSIAKALAQSGAENAEEKTRAKAAAHLPSVKLMQRGATNSPPALAVGRGGSLEDELCPYEIGPWTFQEAVREFLRGFAHDRFTGLRGGSGNGIVNALWNGNYLRLS